MRFPAVAGTFYPLDKEALLSMLRDFEEKVDKKKYDVVAGISPHAGYVYSGKIAMQTYMSIKKAETFVILGPNHYGMGKPIAVSLDVWSTPLGEVFVDPRAEDIAQRFFHDEEAHSMEHSIEVQLPFIQYLFPDAKIIPICIEDQRPEAMKALANVLWEVCPDAIIIASTDFSHYLPKEMAREWDMKGFEAIKNFDSHSLYNLVLQGFSMCGYGPVMCAIEFAKLKGAKDAKLLAYGTSGDIEPMPEVVGYMSIIMV